MFDIGNFISDYLVKGVYRFNAADKLMGFPLDVFEPIKEGDRTFTTDTREERLAPYTPLQQTFLWSLKTNVIGAALSGLNHQCDFSDMWCRVGENVHDWHCDQQLAWPGYNSSLNIYFDDSYGNTGGALQFHPKVNDDPIPDNSPYITTIWPKKYDIVILNQNSNFVHRVTPAQSWHRRRMMSFMLALFDFNLPVRA